MKRTLRKKPYLSLPKSSLSILLAFAVGFITATSYVETPPESNIENQVQACFTPASACTPHIIHAINLAQKRIYVQAYSFTSKPIAEALLKAYLQGIDVQIIVDKSQIKDTHSQAKNLAQKGIPLFIDSKVAIAHNKVIIIDSDKVITGSFNFTNAAEKRNAENFVIIKNATLNQQYLQNWKSRHAVAKTY